MLKKVLACLVSICLVFPCNIALADDSLKDDRSTNQVQQADIDYWRENFESFDKLLNDGTLGELVGSTDMYIKYTPKDENQKVDVKTATKDDFVSEVFTKNEYEKEILQEKMTTTYSRRSTIGDFRTNGTCSWLRLSMTIYEKPRQEGCYIATTFWEWLTSPVFRLKDLNGIYVSSELAIDQQNSQEYQAEFRYRVNGEIWQRETPTVKTSQYGNGAAVEFNLPGSDIMQFDSFRGMLNVPIKFSNSGSICGSVYTNYIHSLVSVGSLSFDKNGLSSFGFGIKQDEFSGSLLINK